MVDVGLGQKITAFGRYRSKVAKDAVRDNHPLMKALEDHKGISRIGGGRTILDESLSGQNTTVGWVGEAGTVSLADQKVLDSPEFDWSYQLGSISMTLAERYQNEAEGRFIDLWAAKQEALEASAMNEFHQGILSSGTGDGGLEIDGVAALVSTTPTTGTVGTIDRSSANAAWYRNQAFNTAVDWTDGAVDAGNVKRFLDKGLNSTSRNSQLQATVGFLGQTHFEFLTSAIQAIQVIQNESGTGKAGYDRLVYRGVPMYFGAGVNYSGATAMTATRTYIFCTKPGGLNLVFHKKAEFDMLEPINASDQAAFSRLMFTMCSMRIGALAKLNWVGFD